MDCKWQCTNIDRTCQVVEERPLDCSSPKCHPNVVELCAADYVTVTYPEPGDLHLDECPEAAVYDLTAGTGCEYCEITCAPPLLRYDCGTIVQDPRESCRLQCEETACLADARGLDPQLAYRGDAAADTAAASTDYRSAVIGLSVSLTVVLIAVVTLGVVISKNRGAFIQFVNYIRTGPVPASPAGA